MNDRENVFDLDGAMTRLGGDLSLFGEIVQYFLEDAPELLGQISAGVHNNDTHAVELAAHSLKGLIANFGAKGAGAAAYGLERRGKSGDLSGAAAQLVQLEQEIVRLKKALEPYSSATRGNDSTGSV